MREALSFLTPIGGARQPTPAALEWFPLVGAGIGGAVGAMWWIAERAWPVAASGLKCHARRPVSARTAHTPSPANPLSWLESAPNTTTGPPGAPAQTTGEDSISPWLVGWVGSTSKRHRTRRASGRLSREASSAYIEPPPPTKATRRPPTVVTAAEDVISP